MNNNPMHNLATLITERFIAAAPKEAATALAGLATHEVIMLIGGLKAQHVITLLNVMESAKAAAVIRRLPLKQASYVLARLEVVQAAKLWKEFSTPYQERLRGVLDPAFINLLASANNFAADSVGRAMSTDFVSVRTETKVGELVGRLKNIPRKKLPSVCFVTTKEGMLKGIIPTAELVFFNQQAVCGSVMNKAEAVHPQDTLSTITSVFDRQGIHCLPVIDGTGIVIGSLEKEVVLTFIPTKKTLWEKLKG